MYSSIVQVDTVTEIPAVEGQLQDRFTKVGEEGQESEGHEETSLYCWSFVSSFLWPPYFGFSIHVK